VACAYGQQYAGLSQSDRAGDTGTSAKENALQAVNRVISLHSAGLEVMRSLWEPSRATPQEDDLVIFFKDDDFKKLLG